MKKTLPGLFITTSDLQRISKKSEKTCQRTLRLIRDAYQLERHQPVTIHQLSDYLAVPLEQLLPYLQ